MTKDEKKNQPSVSQKPIKVDGMLWIELDRWLNTKQAKKAGFHSKAQFATEAIREKLEEFQPRIIIEESMYDKFYDIYEKDKKNTSKKGIRNFGEYVAYMLKDMMEKDNTFAKYPPKIEKISVRDDYVILRDNIKNRIVEVKVENGELVCKLCKKKDCVHVGFVFSLPDVYEILNERGFKNSQNSNREQSLNKLSKL